MLINVLKKKQTVNYKFSNKKNEQTRAAQLTFLKDPSSSSSSSSAHCGVKTLKHGGWALRPDRHGVGQVGAAAEREGGVRVHVDVCSHKEASDQYVNMNNWCSLLPLTKTPAFIKVTYFSVLFLCGPK